MSLELERELVGRAQRGDMSAWEQLYRMHRDALFHRVIRPQVAVLADAEDVLVDTFTTGLERLGQFEWTGRSLFAWLARIAVNKSWDVGRKLARDQRGKQKVVDLQPTVAPPVPADEQLAAAADRKLARRRVEEVLERLNPRYARALRLRMLEERSRPECAELMEVKLGTFDVVLLRASRAFEKRWRSLYGEA